MAICRYVGEIISDCEADTREDDSYLFDLDNRVSVYLQAKTTVVLQVEIVLKMISNMMLYYVS